MRKNEKQVIATLSIAILVVAAALVFCTVTSGSSGKTDDASLNSIKDSVQNKATDEEEETTKETDKTTAKEEKTTEDVSTTEATTSTIQSSEKSETTEAQTSVMDATSGYMFEDSDATYLSQSDVKGLSDEELQYAINEIYARNGLKFTKTKNKERFEKKSWYNGTVDSQDQITLNQYEKKNVDLLKKNLDS